MIARARTRLFAIFVAVSAAAPIVLFSAVLVGSRQADAEERGSYGAKLTFRKGVAIAFSDFTLVYQGARRVPSPRYKRGFISHDFVVASDREKLTVSWSAGTGDIGPTLFTVAHKKFWIELLRSDSLGKLKSGELVVTFRGPAT